MRLFSHTYKFRLVNLQIKVGRDIYGIISLTHVMKTLSVKFVNLIIC